MTKMYKKILCAIDFSPCSMETLKKAIELAKVHKADLNVITVIEPLPTISYAEAINPTIQDIAVTGAKKEMQEIAKKYHLAAENTFVKIGHSKSAILSFAKSIQADLIVIGSHGHRGIIGHLIGSTSSAIANLAKCDVLIVRAST